LKELTEACKVYCTNSIAEFPLWLNLQLQISIRGSSSVCFHLSKPRNTKIKLLGHLKSKLEQFMLKSSHIRLWLNISTET